MDHSPVRVVPVILISDDPAIDKAWQRDCREQPVDPTAPLAEREKRAFSGVGRKNLEAGNLEELNQHPASGLIVVYDEHAGAVRSDCVHGLAQQGRGFRGVGQWCSRGG